jgi:hypothetical protein
MQLLYADGVSGAIRCPFSLILALGRPLIRGFHEGSCDGGREGAGQEPGGVSASLERTGIKLRRFRPRRRRVVFIRNPSPLKNHRHRSAPLHNYSKEAGHGLDRQRPAIGGDILSAVVLRDRNGALSVPNVHQLTFSELLGRHPLL